MARELKLNQLHEAFAELDYPLSKAAAADACSDVTLQLADGTEPLADVVNESTLDEFDSADGLESEVMSHLPRNAVGEPFQSDGDA